MKHIKDLLKSLSEALTKATKDNAVIAKPLTNGNRTVLPVCDLEMGFGVGGGSGEGEGEGAGHNARGRGMGRGSGLGAGGGTSISPKAVIVVEGKNVRIESLI